MNKSLDPKSLDHLLAQVCRLHHAHLFELLQNTGVFRGQPPVLEALIERDGQTHSELGEHLHVKPATMSRMVQRMKRAGMLTTRRDPDDARVSRVYITERGQDAAKALAQAFATSERDAFADFTLEERVLLRRFMMQIRENLIRVVSDKPLLH
jgi:MarR family transcriptional regulator, organic hydroperoxide resistance regulator